MDKGKIVGTCPANQAFSICTVGITIPINMLANKVTSIETGIWEYWEIGYLLTDRWRFVNVYYIIFINVNAQPLSLQCRWRLVEKGLPWSFMDKRSKASFLRSIQLVGSPIELISVQTCSGSPGVE